MLIHLNVLGEFELISLKNTNNLGFVFHGAHSYSGIAGFRNEMGRASDVMMYYSKNDVKTSLKWNILVLSTTFTQWVGTYLPSIFPLFVSFSTIQTVEEEEEEEAVHPPLVCPPCKSTTFDDVLRLLMLLPPDNPRVSNKGKRIKAATSNWLERERVQLKVWLQQHMNEIW